MKKTYLTSLIGAGALVLLVSGLSSAATISLEGTIRDFNASHPNFETVIDGHQTGIVESTLGANGKPVLNLPVTAPSIPDGAPILTSGTTMLVVSI